MISNRAKEDMVLFLWFDKWLIEDAERYNGNEGELCGDINLEVTISSKMINDNISLHKGFAWEITVWEKNYTILTLIMFTFLMLYMGYTCKS